MKQDFPINRIIFLFFLMFFVSLSLNVEAAITEQQGLDVAEFAKNFIEQGNNRRDENGFPLLTYALSGNWNTCIEIRNKGYNEQLYYIKRNSYYYRNGRYMELGDKWCMDCGTFVTYMLKKTLGLELYNGKEPWHVQDIYNDAYKGAKSKNFEFVYRSVSVGKINYSKLKPGDVIARITSQGNHGMLYLGDGMIAHANRDMIKYKAPAVSGFQVSKLNQYYLPGTVVRIMRIKDGIIPADLEVNSLLTWPDNGEIVDLLGRTSAEELERMNLEKKELDNMTSGEISGDTSGEIIVSKEKSVQEDNMTLGEISGDTSGEIIVSEEKSVQGDNMTSGESSGDTSGEIIVNEEKSVQENNMTLGESSGDISGEVIVYEKEELTKEERYQKARDLQETKIQTIRIKPLMVHMHQNNRELYSIRIAFVRSQG